MKNNLPTWLTLLRIALLPVVVVVFYIDAPWARPLSCLIFSVAGITDWLDGYLARKWGVESRFGAFLDPVADKLMVATVLILIVEFDSSPWLTVPAIVIIGREITISALREWMAGMGARSKVAVGWVGKVKTTAQIIALGMLLYLHDFLGLPIYQMGMVALYVAAVLTIWSMIGYMQAAFREPATDPVVDAVAGAGGASASAARSGSGPISGRVSGSGADTAVADERGRGESGGEAPRSG